MIPPAAPAPEDAADAPPPADPLAPLFALSRAYMVSGPTRSRGSLFLFLTLLLFVFSVGPGASPSSVAILVGVLVVHELGHYLGMRAFGYRDVRMFFVPFLGAAVSGRRGGVAAWKDAVVLLLGPVPGVLLGAVALLATMRWPIPALVQLGETLLLVNAFNLLPFGGLDGGKLLLRVVFARHRYLELGFTALGALALGLTALALGSFALGFFAFIGIAGLRRRARVLEVAAELRPVLVDATAETIDDAAARRLFEGARVTVPEAVADDPRAVGATMEDILQATQRAPGFLASTALLGAWAGTFLVAFVTAIVLAHALGPASWERRILGGCSVELPGAPLDAEESYDTPAGPRAVQIWYTSVDIVNHFTVMQLDAGADIAPAEEARWIAAARTRFDADMRSVGVSASVVSEGEAQLAGRPAHETVYRNGWRLWHVRSLVAGPRVFVLVASSPEGSDDERRFFDSFVLNH